MKKLRLSGNKFLGDKKPFKAGGIVMILGAIEGH